MGEQNNCVVIDLKQLDVSACIALRAFLTQWRIPFEENPLAARESRSQRALTGWTLVPNKPTREMQRAYFDEIDRNMHLVETSARFGRWDNNLAAYKKMLQAAPRPPE